MNNPKIKCISVGYKHTMILLEDGEGSIFYFIFYFLIFIFIFIFIFFIFFIFYFYFHLVLGCGEAIANMKNEDICESFVTILKNEQIKSIFCGTTKKI